MDLSPLFVNKLTLTSQLIPLNLTKYHLKVKWEDSAQKINGNIMIALYAARREMDKNYITYFYPVTGKDTYTFDKELPRGFYDVRVLSYTRGITYTYQRLFTIDEFFVGEPYEEKFELVVDAFPDRSEILVKINAPADEGDFIGMFARETVSMKDNYMIGLGNTIFGEGNLQRFFPVNKAQLGDINGKEFQVRFFKKDCEIVNGIDTNRMPFAFSNYFKFETN
ncbi:hypothetical protein EIN_523830 [Entamoeba invadens IP1]|uniref:Uncharacterized protein n=1 Tax=Entamoeba invadens IP1 TaxID=370355 RepID=A0A0A1UEX5_ENTIV|nr:hypothetical protein EIN_523830 [Entamoeba invadens IP1]ELP92485.1 hypothetical protein EIN_523830 [Entamoeba invadens IP1]|eukprot:XP_004259256.1 hypothetical protein EIN_523830 [Entamoeba invadens IP1]